MKIVLRMFVCAVVLSASVTGFGLNRSFDGPGTPMPFPPTIAVAFDGPGTPMPFPPTIAIG